VALKKRCDCAAKTKCAHHWHYDFRVGGRRYRDSTNTADKKLARDLEAVERTRAIELGHGIKRAVPITVRNFWPRYLDAYAKVELKPSTLARTERAWKVLDRHFGPMVLSEVDGEAIGRFTAARLKQGVTPAGINRELAVLSGLLEKAKEWNYLPSRPTVPLLKVDNTKTLVVSDEDQSRLLNHFQRELPDFYPALQLLLITGARRGEILDLKWSQWQSGAWAGEQWLPGSLELDGKTGRRVLPTTPEIDGILKRVERQGPKVFWFAQLTFYKAFKAACRKLGLSSEVTIHTLRHTALTRMLIEQRTDVRTVMEISGHKQMSMLQRYTHPNVMAKIRALGHKLDTGEADASPQPTEQPAVTH
jgi:integrase